MHYRYLLVPGNTKSSLSGCPWDDGEPEEHYDVDGWLRPSDVINLVRVLVNSTYLQNGSRTIPEASERPCFPWEPILPHTWLTLTATTKRQLPCCSLLMQTSLALSLEATDTFRTPSP